MSEQNSDYGKKKPLAIAIEEINTTNDLLFKHLFGTEDNQENTVNLINSVLKNEIPNPVTSVTFFDRELPADFADLKSTRFDIGCKLAKGQRIIVEMQVIEEPNFVDRMLFYWCRQYGNQLPKGKKFSKLCPVYLIVILNFKLHKGFKVNFPYSHCYVYNEEYRLKESNHLTIHWLEVPHLNLQQNFNKLRDVDKWLAFFANKNLSADARSTLMQKPEINKAYTDACDFFADEARRFAYESREMALREYSSNLDDIRINALKEGEKKGFARGKLQIKEEIIRHALANGNSVKEISRFTGLSIKEVEEICQSESPDSAVAD